MAITYVNDLRLSEMGTGDNSGTWGTVTNTNLELIGDAMGYGTRAIANASTDNITIADGTADADRAMYLKLTGGGQACTVTLLPNTVSKVWMMENGTNSALTFTQGSGANVIIPAGDTKIIASDGAGSGAIVYDVLASLSVVDLKVQDDLTVTDDVAIGGLATVGGTLGVTGVVTANAGVVVDNFTLDGTTLALSSGDMTLDSAAGIILDAANGTIALHEAGNGIFGSFVRASGTFSVRANTNINFRGGIYTFDNAAGSSEYARFDTSGNLGIGGTPNVYSGYTALTLNHATNGGILDFEKDGTLVGELFLPDVNTFAVTAVGAKAVSFNTNSAERMRISSAGNIGIGTTSPSDPLVVSDSGASSVTARLINTNADGNPANLRLQKLSGSPADGDYIGMLNVSGENDASEEIIFQSIDFISTDVSDGTEDGDIAFRTRGAGTLAEKMRISSNGDVSLNNGGSNTNLRLQNTNSGSGSTDGFLLQHATNAITYVWNYENAATVFGTNSTERMRISSAGLVGIGTTSPSAGLTIEAADGSTSGTIMITSTSVASGGMACDASGLNFGADTGGFVFKTGGSANDPTDTGTERLSINSSGVIQLGTALTFGGTVNVNASGIGVGESGSSGSYRRMYWNESNNEMRFWNGNNEARITDGGAFTNASDVSLKKDIAEIEYGIDTVKSLKPRKYKLKSSDLEQIGFVAQEIETQVPEVVSTGITPDGDEQKGIAYGQLTAVLTKALQEAIAKIETLETKVKALEG